MHGWLPATHMHHHITGTNQCPRCKCNDKTFDHLLQCPNLSITETRKGILTQMRTTGIKLRARKDVLNAITQTLTTYTEGKLEPTNCQYKAEIATAVSYQQKIGIDMMARGFLSKQSLHTIQPSRNPTRTMNKIQRLIWMEFFEPVIKQKQNTPPYHQYTQADNEKLTESIIWYCDNHHLLFAHHDTHLMDNINTGALNTMPREQKQEWLRHIEIANEVYEKE
jgi:hypothetical protein